MARSGGGGGIGGIIGRIIGGAATGGLYGDLPAISQAQAVIGFIGELSDPATWRSVAWTLMGFSLFLTGIFVWVRQSQAYHRAENTAVAVATRGASLGAQKLSAPVKGGAKLGDQELSLPDLSKVGKVSTPAGDVSVIAVLLMVAGLYLMWFGIHYWRDAVTTKPTDPIKDVLRGLGLPKPQRTPGVATQLPDAVTAAGPGTTGTGTPAGLAGGLGVATGDAIARDASSYAGKVRYTWGGASPSTGWDCSGFVNWVLCHDMGLDIPGVQGGHFDGRTHGPNVAEWLAWASGTEIVGLA